MPYLEALFPTYVTELVRTQGIAQAITTLNGLGDTGPSQTLYQSYASRLTIWAATSTIPNQPETAAV